MPVDLANHIETYLRAAKGWVSAEDLCVAFDVNKRDLRAHGDRPGLCSRFAISGNKGFRHIAHCTPAEFTHFCSRVVSHAEGELARVNDLRTARAAALQPTDRPLPVFERGSGQALLLTPP